MPRKASEKAAAKAKANAKVAAQPPAQPLADAPLVVAVPPSTPPSTALMMEIEECIKMIQAHEGLSDIASLAPLGMGEGGSCAAFKIKDLETSLAAGAMYVSTCNFGWVDWKYTNSPGVPVLRNAIVDGLDISRSNCVGANIRIRLMHTA